MLIKIDKTKWLNANDISFLNIDYNDRKQVYVVRIWVNDRYYDYYDYYRTYEKAVKALAELVPWNLGCRKRRQAIFDVWSFNIRRKRKF